jgi:hypothetical protein
VPRRLGSPFSDSPSTVERLVNCHPVVCHPAPAVINEQFARHFFPSRDPIGQVFATGRKWVVPEFQITGVVNDTKYRSLREVPPPIYYLEDFGSAEETDTFILHVRPVYRYSPLLRVRKPSPPQLSLRAETMRCLKRAKFSDHQTGMRFQEITSLRLNPDLSWIRKRGVLIHKNILSIPYFREALVLQKKARFLHRSQSADTRMEFDNEYLHL